MGLAYKKNINDPRESPAIKIIEELANVPALVTKAGVFSSVGSIEEALAGAKCAVFLVDHDIFRRISMETLKRLMASPVIVGGKNLFACGKDGVEYMAIGKSEMQS